MDQAVESVASADATLVVVRRDGNRLEKRGSLLERAVRAMRVVVRDVVAQHPLQVLARDNQDPVQALTPDAADPALGVRLRPWRRDRSADYPDPLRTEDLVEGGGELAIAIADQEAGPLLLLVQGHDQVPRLLLDPGAVWVGGDACQMHAAPPQFDEEEHV